MTKRKLSIAAGTIAIFITIAVIGQPTALHLACLHPPYEGKVAGALPRNQFGKRHSKYEPGYVAIFNQLLG